MKDAFEAADFGSGQNNRVRKVDNLAYVVGIGGNVAAIPQILTAWQSKAPGLAIATWLAFLAIGVFWLVYSIIHRQKPLIFAQIVSLSCTVAVIFGWFWNNLR